MSVSGSALDHKRHNLQMSYKANFKREAFKIYRNMPEQVIDELGELHAKLLMEVVDAKPNRAIEEINRDMLQL